MFIRYHLECLYTYRHQARMGFWEKWTHSPTHSLQSRPYVVPFPHQTWALSINYMFPCIIANLPYFSFIAQLLEIHDFSFVYIVPVAQRPKPRTWKALHCQEERPKRWVIALLSQRSLRLSVRNPEILSALHLTHN